MNMEIMESGLTIDIAVFDGCEMSGLTPLLGPQDVVLLENLNSFLTDLNNFSQNLNEM